jgi:hypothetical protein
LRRKKQLGTILDLDNTRREAHHGIYEMFCLAPLPVCGGKVTTGSEDWKSEELLTNRNAVPVRRREDHVAMQTQHTVEIPQSVLISAQSLDDLEDWLAANNPEFLGEVRRIRNEEDLAGSGKDIAEVLQRWPIE